MTHREQPINPVFRQKSDVVVAVSCSRAYLSTHDDLSDRVTSNDLEMRLVLFSSPVSSIDLLIAYSSSDLSSPDLMLLLCYKIYILPVVLVRTDQYRVEQPVAPTVVQRFNALLLRSSRIASTTSPTPTATSIVFVRYRLKVH